MGETLYRWLMEHATGDTLDAHCFACVIAARCEEREGSLAARLGLSGSDLSALVAAHFGGLQDWEGLCARGAEAETTGEEESDLIRLFLDHRAIGAPEEKWFAAILAHAAQRANHLWQDLGLTGREDVARLIERHFPTLKALNHRDMKWKKFLYKQLCEREDIHLCKAPNCDVCSDFADCFGSEDGDPMTNRSSAHA